MPESATLDTKTYARRVGRLRGKLTWKPDFWIAYKQCVMEGRPLDAEAFLGPFRHGVLRVPKAKVPITREEHMALKGMYTFLQQGYFLRQGGRVALFHRSARDPKQGAPRITAGGSVLLSAPYLARDGHAAGLEKLRAQAGLPSGAPLAVRPFALGFTELARDGRGVCPAYAWLIHEVVPEAPLPGVRAAVRDRDAFLGMKDPGRVLGGLCRAAGMPVPVEGGMDRALLRMLSSGTGSPPREAGTGLRPLRPGEFDRFPDIPRRRDEDMGRALLALKLVKGAVKVWAAAEAASTGEYAYARAGELLNLVISRLAG